MSGAAPRQRMPALNSDGAVDFVFRSEDDAASCYFHLSHTPRPHPDASQSLRFRVRLHQMVAHSPASHFAIALRAHLGFDAEGRPAWMSGRGMTLGDTSGAEPIASNPHAFEPGFGGARGAQIESFWRGGNFLYRDTALFPEGLRDDCWYSVDLKVGAQRVIEAIITDLQRSPNLEQRACVQDRAAHPVPDDDTGVLIALGRGPVETGPWHAEFRDIRVAWG